MKVIYTPKDGDSQEFALRFDEMLSIHVEPLEEVGGAVWEDWEGFKAALAANKTRAKRAILWHFLRQQKPEMTFAELVVGADDIAIAPDDEDIRRARELVMSEGTEDQRREFVEMFGEGKEPSENSDTPTDGESLESSDNP